MRLLQPLLQLVSFRVKTNGKVAPPRRVILNKCFIMLYKMYRFNCKLRYYVAGYNSPYSYLARYVKFVGLLKFKVHRSLSRDGFSKKWRFKGAVSSLIASIALICTTPYLFESSAIIWNSSVITLFSRLMNFLLKLRYAKVLKSLVERVWKS